MHDTFMNDLHGKLKMKKEKFTLLEINISDYKSICIGNVKTNRIICYMNTMDGNYGDLLKYCQIMVDALNCKKLNKWK